MESALSTQKLKPTIDAIKRLYGDDKNKIQRETSELYKKSGVSPTAGAQTGSLTCATLFGRCRAGVLLPCGSRRVQVLQCRERVAGLQVLGYRRGFSVW